MATTKMNRMFGQNDASKKRITLKEIQEARYNMAQRKARKGGRAKTAPPVSVNNTSSAAKSDLEHEHSSSFQERGLFNESDNDSNYDEAEVIKQAKDQGVLHPI